MLPQNDTIDNRMKAATASLLLGCFAYPFSIAAFSFFFGLMVVFSLIRFESFRNGIHVCWYGYRSISIGVLCIIALNIVGILWSDDTDTANHKILKQINWLIVPVVIGISSFIPKLRKYIFIVFSIALFVHLVVCTCQYLGLISITGQGSNQGDPAGFIGHLSFGFVYSIWAGALLIAAQNFNLKWRVVCYLLAVYAVFSIFVTEGRSGYLLAFVMLILVLWKAFFHQKIMLKLTAVFLVIILFILLVFFSAPFQDELQQTMKGITSYINGDWRLSEPRLKIWLTSIELWKSSPYFGIGTGDYYNDAYNLLQKTEFMHLRTWSSYYSHPHNEFLFSLVRWGPIGLLAFIYLCWAWLGTGWKKDWQHDTMNAYLCTSSALAVIIHGVTEVSLNGKLTLVYAILILAFSMTKPLPEEMGEAKENSQL